MKNTSVISLLFVSPELLANPNLAGPTIGVAALLVMGIVLLMVMVGPIILTLFTYRKIANEDISKRRVILLQLPSLIVGLFCLSQVLFPPYDLAKLFLLGPVALFYLAMSALVYKKYESDCDIT